MKKFVLALMGLLFTFAVFAANLTLKQVEWYYEPGPEKEAYVKLTLSWDAAWHNERNHDAAWLTFKYKPENWGARPALLAQDGHEWIKNGNTGMNAPAIVVPLDQTGAFIFPKEKHRGSVEWTIKLALDTAIYANRRFAPFQYRMMATGIEMVYIPAGGFVLGDLDEGMMEEGLLYRSEGDGQYGGLFEIAEEGSTIEIGPEQGKLYYQVRDSIYQGDQKGTIPSSFPKGVEAFYVMKYELKQGQYATFLSTLSDNQSQHRANFGGRNYYPFRGTIRFDGQNYLADAPDRPCNFLSWDDAMAFADWAGLRPMTELEFTKACRGTRKPVFHERPWGKESRDLVARYVTPTGDLTFADGLDENNLNDTNREVYGASEYWVFDLAGSLWERVITIGDEKGRSFQGSHGDGEISNFGFANVPDWPSGVSETGGYGFRGGGYYENGKVIGNQNPHAPVGHRRYGAWSGGNRTEAYGSRFVRTAD